VSCRSSMDAPKTVSGEAFHRIAANGVNPNQHLVPLPDLAMSDYLQGSKAASARLAAEYKRNENLERRKALGGTDKRGVIICPRSCVCSGQRQGGHV